MRMRPTLHERKSSTTRRRAILALTGALAMVVGLGASSVELYEFLFQPRAAQSAPTVVIPELPAPIVIVPPAEVVARPEGATAPVSGSWDLHTLVERTTYRKYEGLHTLYRINLIETSDGQVTGTGELWSENGVEVTGLNHLLIDFSGYHDGFTLRLNYRLAGRSRPSTGALALHFDEESMQWKGTFESGVAASSGTARLESRQHLPR